jgi:nucleoid-associated protein YgaU
VFLPTSRYFGIETARLAVGEGRWAVYVRRRFLPQPESLALVREHVVVAGDRLDNVAARHLGDPEQFWQIADANGAMRPDELTETPGRRLRITLPAGVQGMPGA